ncbi:hypothetical protein PENSPDRAFT_308273 [Peniophora sp. CONT]|nr:hypothetical protein PENSPDRAFT_308273 [Peniophora sp. CONT]
MSVTFGHFASSVRLFVELPAERITRSSRGSGGEHVGADANGTDYLKACTCVSNPSVASSASRRSSYSVPRHRAPDFPRPLRDLALTVTDATPPSSSTFQRLALNTLLPYIFPVVKVPTSCAFTRRRV